MRILLLAKDDQEGSLTAALQAAVPGGDVVLPVSRTQAEVRELLPSVDVVVGDWTFELALGAAEAEIAPHLRLVQQPSVGTNCIDVDAWVRVGVPVANTPGANAASVAEWAVVAAASVSRSMMWADVQMREPGWPQWAVLKRGSRDLGDRRVGILGFGDIGGRCAALFEAFGCAVAYSARRARPGATARHLPLDDLLAESNVLVVAVPLTEQTRGMIGSREIGLLHPGSIVVNVARGPIVDETALTEALSSGHLGGAALDVFDSEPLASDSPLRSMDNVLLSPHVAGGSDTARQRICEMAARNVARVSSGLPPLWVQTRTVS
ncbi:dehydrogenase [Rhodococcus sp. WMMA185]|uniref:NAD(P)-dependent oxidoreductase n=1 Tax=Rhodococcus sp. WMMA185 TaxID=679318 RepID=UPI00087819AB|nr:NAD(P)-dependent oxidoreductase [Rhodococcus sp. WMMA185]AOW93996.1 dehydrogenase [Rhodococcus sp. WMMA185]